MKNFKIKKLKKNTIFKKIYKKLFIKNTIRKKKLKYILN